MGRAESESEMGNEKAVKKIKAYHFLRNDMCARCGDEPPWSEGETRTMEGEIVLCERGYHSSPSWLAALGHAHGSMASIVRVSEPVTGDRDKQVSHTRTLVAARNAERELRLFACECLEQRLGGAARLPLTAGMIEMARAYARGEVTLEEFDACASRTNFSWSFIVHSFAHIAADHAAWQDAGRYITASGAWLVECAWLEQRLAEYLDPLFEKAKSERKGDA